MRIIFCQGNILTYERPVHCPIGIENKLSYVLYKEYYFIILL